MYQFHTQNFALTVLLTMPKVSNNKYDDIKINVSSQNISLDIHKLYQSSHGSNVTLASLARYNGNPN